MLETGLYLPCNIYNMDEVGFNLSSNRRVRAVGPRGSSSKSQSALAGVTHISIVAAIGTHDAPVPPLLVYSGGNLLHEWLQPRDLHPQLAATVTDSGWANSYIIKRWLIEQFDVSTRERAETTGGYLYSTDSSRTFR